jgi:hypothetical protein
VPKASKILPEIVEKNTLLGRFWVIFGCFLGSGARRVSGPEKSAKNGLDLVWILARFWTVLALFGVLLRVFFLRVFRSAHFAHFGRFCGPGVAKKEVFGDHFDAILAAGPTCENRRFTCTGAQF